MASTHDLSEAVSHLTLARAKGGLSQKDASEVYRLLESAIRSGGIEGFWVVAADESTLLRWPQSLPRTVPRFMMPAIERALDGLPSLSPFPGDRREAPRLTATAPIRGAKGEAVGILVIALPAQQELNRLAEQSHNRSLGQVYFFDRAGRILGMSDPGSEAISGALLKEPGTRHLTRMARSATGTSSAGTDLDGYRDNHGNLVVGSWEWDEQLGLGVAAETDARTAYHTVETARSALLGGVIITLVLFLAVLATLLQSRQRAVALSAIQRRLAAVLESTTDPVCFADRKGRPIYLNDAGRALLGDGLPNGPFLKGARPGWTRVLLRPEGLAHAAEAGSWSGEATVLTPGGR
jgi:PAS domain-containing protein